MSKENSDLFFEAPSKALERNVIRIKDVSRVYSTAGPHTYIELVTGSIVETTLPVNLVLKYMNVGEVEKPTIGGKDKGKEEDVDPETEPFEKLFNDFGRAKSFKDIMKITEKYFAKDFPKKND